MCNSKAKGSGAEREVCGILKAHGFPAWRNDQRYRGGFEIPDVSARGLDGYHLEIKRAETLRINDWWLQAAHDAGWRKPVVVFRRSHEPWKVVLLLDDFLKEVTQTSDRARCYQAGSAGGGGGSTEAAGAEERRRDPEGDR